ncbi:hypothetical protein COCOBI_10-0380 [Coccomyxa sp. Obi]|nr:hypothetical protein COCOBI_10-0380 [Coccomyxa sp. Obi]
MRMSDGSTPIQRSPAGWEAFYGKFNIGKDCGKIYYTTECICRNSRGQVKKRCSAPHRLRQWADIHGDHRPEYQVLKPRPEEYYPDGGKGRTKHPGYKKYQERMQSLGFYTSVRMLERNGYRLPDEAQAEWDQICQSAQREAELTQAGPRGQQGDKQGRHGFPTDEVTSEDDSDAEVSAEEESGADVTTRAAEFSSRTGDGAEPSSMEELDGWNRSLHTNTSKRHNTKGCFLNGNSSGLQRGAKRARVAAHANTTEAATAMSSDEPAGPPQHTEQLLEKIRLIQEMLPEYGDGFLAACLRAGGYVVESIVEQLLDGSWRQVPELRNLDPTMPLQPASWKSRRRALADKQSTVSGSVLAAGNDTAANVITLDGSAEPPETPDQTKEETQCAAWRANLALGAAVQPDTAPSARGQNAEGVRLSAPEQGALDLAEEGTPGATVQPSAAPSAPGDSPCLAARLTRSLPDQDEEGTPRARPQPDAALCGAGPAERAGPSAPEQTAANGARISPLLAAQSSGSIEKGRSGPAGEVVDLSAPVGTACAVPSGLGQGGANLGSVDLTPDSPRTSCATQLPAALSNLNVIQGDKGEGSLGPAADQAQYMPSTVAMLPPAFACPMQTTPAASRAAACSLDDAIADLSTLKAAWDSGAASAGRRFSFDAILLCLHSARMCEGLAQQQEATITRLRACASAVEQEKMAVIGRLRARVDALEDELVILKRCVEKSESMLASKNREILALRSQVDVYEAS